MIANNDRALLTDDMTHCAWHPDRDAVAWRDVPDERDVRSVSVGVCEECSALIPAPSAVKLLTLETP